MLPLRHATSDRRGNSWERALREAATRGQMGEWGRGQDGYAPHDALMGAGEVVMWGALHPTTDGCLGVKGCGALHRAQHMAPST